MDNKIISLASIRNSLEGLQARLTDERSMGLKSAGQIREALQVSRERALASVDTAQSATTKAFDEARKQINTDYDNIISVIGDEMGERDKSLGEALEGQMEAAEERDMENAFNEYGLLSRFAGKQ